MDNVRQSINYRRIEGTGFASVMSTKQSPRKVTLAMIKGEADDFQYAQYSQFMYGRVVVVVVAVFSIIGQDLDRLRNFCFVFHLG